MSKYEDQMDDCYAICPYCESKYQVEGEDFHEDSRPEKCDNCGKQYHINQSFSVTHNTEPDCGLNGDKHQYEPFTFKDGRTKGFCEICGQIEQHKEANP